MISLEMIAAALGYREALLHAQALERWKQEEARCERRRAERLVLIARLQTEEDARKAVRQAALHDLQAVKDRTLKEARERRFMASRAGFSEEDADLL